MCCKNVVARIGIWVYCKYSVLYCTLTWGNGGISLGFDSENFESEYTANFVSTPVKNKCWEVDIYIVINSTVHKEMILIIIIKLYLQKQAYL
jgi:hypothetical protein